MRKLQGNCSRGIDATDKCGERLSDSNVYQPPTSQGCQIIQSYSLGGANSSRTGDSRWDAPHSRHLNFSPVGMFDERAVYFTPSLGLQLVYLRRC